MLVVVVGFRAVEKNHENGKGKKTKRKKAAIFFWMH
jgi:hypothetical protein